MTRRRRRRSKTVRVAESDPAAARLLDVGALIVNSESYAEIPWVGITVSATIQWPLPSMMTTGWVYTDVPINGGQLWQGATPKPFKSFKEAAIDLARAMAERDEGEPWRHCCIQIVRSTGQIKTRFSHDQESPWWSPADLSNLDAWVEALRPVAGEEPTLPE